MATRSSETRASLEVNTDDQAMTSTALSHGKRLNSAAKRRRRNLEVLFNNTTIIPFKWRGSYLCFYCGTTLKEYQELRSHTKTHHHCSVRDYVIQECTSAQYEIKLDISDIICELCRAVLPDLKNTINHLNTDHKLHYDKTVKHNFFIYKLSDLSCLECNERFSYFRNLVRHVNKEHPDKFLVCDKCPRSFNKRRDLSTHFKNYHMSKGYNCDECKKIFQSNVKLRFHKEHKHWQTCNICFETFRSTAQKMQHIDEVHLSQGFKCQFCNKQLRTRQAFLQHINRCTVKRVDSQNNKQRSHKTLKSADDKPVPLRVAIRNNLACIFNMSSAIPFKFFMNKFRCFYCTDDFHDPDLLREHTRMEHPICSIKHKSLKLNTLADVDIKIDIYSLKCNICSEPLPDFDSLIHHLTSEHQAVYDTSVNSKIIAFRLIKDDMRCPLCDSESYKFFGHVLKHMNSAHSNNKLICVYCGRTFRTDPNLRSHISRRHKPRAKVTCTDCDMVFKNSAVLKLHLASYHGKTVIACPKCPEHFTTMYMRKRHLIEAHNSGFACSHCGKMFIGNGVLQSHIRRTHLKEKTVECQFCHMKFFDKYMLETHMVRHDGTRNFHCDTCGKKFMWKKNLINHMTTHDKLGRLDEASKVAGHFSTL